MSNDEVVLVSIFEDENGIDNHVLDSGNHFLCGKMLPMDGISAGVHDATLDDVSCSECIEELKRIQLEKQVEVE